MLRWTSNIIDSSPSLKEAAKVIGKVAFQAWFIWKSRNGLVFNHEQVDPSSTIIRAAKAQSEYELINAVQSQVLDHCDDPPLAISAWRKPTPGSFKINCDVAMKREGLRANAAVVVRNDRGELTDGSTYFFKCSSVLQGELEAIRKACFLARDMCAVPVTIESDNKTAILLSASELVPPWEVYPLIMDIRAVKKQRNLEFIWVKRSANKVAHRVASLAAKGKLSLDWVANSPASLVSLLLHDNQWQNLLYQRCGNIDIPYPFGIGPSCPIADGFAVTCNDSFNPPKPFINSINLEVLHVSLSGTVQVNNPVIASNCSGRADGQDVNFLAIQFSFSDTYNRENYSTLPMYTPFSHITYGVHAGPTRRPHMLCEGREY
ncbi:hypothetical protein RHSIM_RhsimUnG0047500 [Rhododendron simsii]|uniref:RNase H type-1 domain-containing protein n=1 Tax=Rhododendron simsii TaxID=118357 RepID=A0A834FYZ7_RHOSS|nr:hypothetical protein RHSIM_RhsimUnG0047500 [Rhododendron simsii]